MDEDTEAQHYHTRREPISIEAHGPGGFWGRLSGIDVGNVLVSILVVVVLGVAGFAWNDGRNSDEKSKVEYLAAHKATQVLLATVIANENAIMNTIQQMQAQNVKIAESVDDTSYILTLTQQQREKLHLEMPYSLRRKLNER